MRTLFSSSISSRSTGFCLAITCLSILNVAGQDLSASSAGKAGQHLFILSGQSNMTGGLAKGFTGKVEEAFGKENVSVAMSMKSGRGIRYWCSDYRYPDKRKPSEQEQADNGSLYQPLIDAVKAAAADKSFDTVTFIWMQGESDAGKGRSEVYAESFLKLLDRLKTDLNREHILFVIGRISDHDMQNPNWTNMREAQIKLAESHPDGAWIDTDDLNGGEPGVPGGDLHYGKDEAGKLGERFATKAIAQIREKREPKHSP
jgi:hypothetical protein